MKAAKAAAMSRWTKLQRKPAADGALTLGKAIEQYLDAKTLAPKTVSIARYNVAKYLSEWSERSLEEIGRDRFSMRVLQQTLTRDHGPSTSNQVVRLIAAVYRWQRKTNPELPETPTVVAEIHKIKPRDWAYTETELQRWWFSTSEEDSGSVLVGGVSTLGIVKRTWWLAALFTGARKGSIEALEWRDVDLRSKTIRFRVTKGDRPYTVPISERLAEVLKKYRFDEVPPSDWVFPSMVIDGGHLKDVKNPKEGVGPAHRLRHTFRTTLAQLGATPDQSRLLMGHSLGNDVSAGYITSALVIESLRPITNAVAEQYCKVLKF